MVTQCHIPPSTLLLHWCLSGWNCNICWQRDLYCLCLITGRSQAKPCTLGYIQQGTTLWNVQIEICYVEKGVVSTVFMTFLCETFHNVCPTEHGPNHHPGLLSHLQPIACIALGLIQGHRQTGVAPKSMGVGVKLPKELPQAQHTSTSGAFNPPTTTPTPISLKEASA